MKTHFQTRHYKDIASAIALSGDRFDLIDALIKMFRQDSMNFNEAKFRDYIEYLKDHQ